MKKLKTQKGITLVALIITIVVLLILAAVAIGTVRDSDIIGYAQNAAGGYNQAKNNEVDTITKYEEQIEKYVPGEKKEYIGKLRLNTKYLLSGKSNNITATFYADGKVDNMGNIMDYTLNGNEVELMGLKCEIIKEEKNDLIYVESQNLLLATSTENLKFFNGQKYIKGEQSIILNENDWTYKDDYSGSGGAIPPVIYNGIVYGIFFDGNGDGVNDIITSSDNGETLILCGEVFTKVTE